MEGFSLHLVDLKASMNVFGCDDAFALHARLVVSCQSFKNEMSKIFVDASSI